MADVTLAVDIIPANRTNDREIAYIDISSIDNVANKIVTPKRLKLSEAPSRARQIVQSRDVLFSTVRPYLRNIAAVPDALDGEIASTGFAVLRAAHGVDPTYLFYKVTSRDFVAALTGEQYGVSYPAVKDVQVRAQAVELPPTPEQHRIVAKIEELFSELDKAIETLTLAQAQLDTYRQALLKAAFEGKLTADWRADNPDKLEPPETFLTRIRDGRDARYEQSLREWRATLAPRTGGQQRQKSPKPVRPVEFTQLPSSEERPSLPSEWIWCQVDGLLREPLSNGRSVKDRQGGFPVLRLTAFENGRLRLSEHKEGAWTRAEAESWLVGEGDFFASRGNGSIRLVGTGALAKDVSIDVAYPDTMIRMALDTDVVEPEYFALAWNSRIVRNQIEAAARTTAGIYKINQAQIGSFAVPIPSREEQRAIVLRLVQVLSVIDHQAEEIDIGLARTNALRQSILKKAFSGKLVAQDPTDEPAAALIARLRKERPVPRTRRRNTA